MTEEALESAIEEYRARFEMDPVPEEMRAICRPCYVKMYVPKTFVEGRADGD